MPNPAKLLEDASGRIWIIDENAIWPRLGFDLLLI